ncbi:PID-CTERM protein-sorting domain-containing protein [Gracilimonas sp.]|uniref:PID-CTERM protein-sorting domain-containing protein n=1 Tax=Gracilimonas sp. TaxID=1974203 RepID=UPI003BACB5D5
MKASTKKMIWDVTIRVFGVMAIMIVFATISYAQAPGPPSFPSSPSAAPIDGGLGLLAAAGGSYALKKLRDKKKATEDPEM